jgi:glycosyltransferase involved in cell wall biosynthesis
VRINYWTTASLEPEFEAVSKEICELATHFPNSHLYSVSPHLRFKLARKPFTCGVHPSVDPLLRVMIPLLELRADLNHVYAEVNPWIYFRSLRSRPIVLTIANEKGQLEPAFLRRCRAIVVQTEGMLAKLHESGLDAANVRLIYPGVDLSRFRSVGARLPASKPRILLATFPRTAEELQSRGVLFLLEVAKRAPHLQFSLLTRPWRSGSTSVEPVREIIERQQLANVRVLEGVHEMATLYAEHEFTVIPYTQSDGGKECPLSLVETLACGVPALISSVAPFSKFVAKHDCGHVFDLDVESFVSAVDSGIANYDLLSRQAIRCAHEHFDRSRTLEQYAAVYRDALV